MQLRNATAPAPSSISHFIQTTPVCDLGSPSSSRRLPSESSMSKTGRKTYKTDKAKREAVWPDYLEAWLLQGILLYSPEPSRTGRQKSKLQRFPRRNKMISDFIFDNTGKRRHPKQVGSRIQQLRQTCRDPLIRRALTDLGRFASEDATSEEGSPEPTQPKEEAIPELDPIDSDDTLSLASSPSSSSFDSTALHFTPTASHLVELHVDIVDDEWCTYPPLSDNNIMLSLPSMDNVSSTHPISCTSSHAGVLSPPLFTVVSQLLDSTSDYTSYFEVYSGETRVDNVYGRLSRVSDANELLIDIPASAWQAAIDFPQSSPCSIVQHIRPASNPSYTVVLMKYTVSILYRQSAPPNSLHLDNATLPSTTPASPSDPSPSPGYGQQLMLPPVPVYSPVDTSTLYDGMTPVDNSSHLSSYYSLPSQSLHTTTLLAPYSSHSDYDALPSGYADSTWAYSSSTIPLQYPSDSY